MKGLRGAIVASALVAGALAVANAPASPQALTGGQGFKQVGSWGSAGEDNGQFGTTAGLATDEAGRIFVADSNNYRLQIFSKTGVFENAITVGGLEHHFVPDVAVDPDGNAWGTTDTFDQAMSFTRDGQYLGSIVTPKQAMGLAADAQGNIYVGTYGDDIHRVMRYDKNDVGTTLTDSILVPGDVEVSPDGTIYVSDLSNPSALKVKRFNANGDVLGTWNAGLSAPVGLGVDLDCNLWMTNIAERRLDRRTPSGKLIGTAASPDLIAHDVVVGLKGDLYAFDGGTFKIIHFAENRAKPATANIPGTLTAIRKTVKIVFTLNRVACPAEVGATATLTGKGIAGRAVGLKLKVGMKNTIAMKLSKAASGKATFEIVLKTNGRPTKEVRKVTVVSK